MGAGGAVTDQDAVKLLLRPILQSLGLGVVLIDAADRIALWNGFMERHSGQAESSLVGRSLFDAFPELPRAWLAMKLRTVRSLRTASFTSFEQRPYLFRFAHNRPITGLAEWMYQSCSFLPISSGEEVFTCITVQDQTDAAMSRQKLMEVTDTNKMLEALSATDPLTSALNRGQIERLLDAEFCRSKRHKTVFSVLMFDLDHFKQVNDSYGHLAGDEVLRSVARAVQGQLRRSDLFGRYGGEEFLAVLPETATLGALEIGERIRAHIAALPIVHGENKIFVTTSLGVAQYRDEMADYLELLHAADVALYDSKHGGRNRVSGYPGPVTATRAG